jgi:cob(I)alamin adenosyltransferase
VVTGREVPKHHPCIEFVGSLDEAEAAVGFSWSLAQHHGVEDIAQLLRSVEALLFRLGFSVASRSQSCVGDSDVKWLEENIDRLSGEVPQAFVLNGGHPLPAAIGLARAAVRRAERAYWRCLSEAGLNRESRYMVYGRLLNRVSDLLFVLQHFAARRLGVEPQPISCR